MPMCPVAVDIVLYSPKGTSYKLVRHTHQRMDLAKEAQDTCIFIFSRQLQTSLKPVTRL